MFDVTAVELMAAVAAGDEVDEIYVGGMEGRRERSPSGVANGTGGKPRRNIGVVGRGVLEIYSGFGL